MFYDAHGNDELAEKARVDEDLGDYATCEIVKEVMAKAAALVEANRRGVVAVAEELLRRKVLSETSVREIVLDSTSGVTPSDKTDIHHFDMPIGYVLA